MRICAWIFRKRFFTKNAFSPEGEFLPKNYVVLFYVNSINNSMRVCAYAHGYPPIPFFFFSILLCEVLLCRTVVFADFLPADSSEALFILQCCLLFCFFCRGKEAFPLSSALLCYCPADVCGPVFGKSVFD